MRRQTSFSPEHQCDYTYNNYENGFTKNQKNPSYRENSSPAQCECCKCKGVKRHSFEANSSNNDQLDEQTKHALSSLRQKACRFIKSDLENTTSSESSSKPCTCQHSNQSKERSIIKKTQDTIDYAPESEFLKKMKRPCQCLNSQQRREGFSPNSNRSNGSSQVHYCEECIAKSNQIIKLLEQLNYIRLCLPDQNSPQCRCCQSPTSQQELDSSGLFHIVETCRNVVNDLKAALACVRPFTKKDGLESGEMGTGNEIQNYEEMPYFNDKNLKKAQSKSQHVSRSKKRVKCRGRRKRKSNDSEKCNSQENFEPSLKKPHENSCERCWRYASPSRSPVNKPDQRYDPNFRRAHSCDDFLGNGDGNETEAEMYQTQNVSPNIQPADTRNRMTGSSMVDSRCPEQNYGSTKVKELMFESLDGQRPPRRYQREKKKEEIDNYVPPEYSERERRPRPKSCTTDTAERGNDVKVRMLSPPTESSMRSMRNDPCLNSPRTREKNFGRTSSRIKLQVPSNEILENVSPIIKSSRDRNQFDLSRNGKFDWDSNSTAYRSLEQEKQSVQSSGRPFVECQCNSGKKTYTSKYPEPCNKSRIRQEISPPSKTQSFLSVENQWRTSSEKRPQTADYDTQMSTGGRTRNPPPSRSREAGQFGECKCYNYHNSSPIPPRTNAFEETNGRKDLCCHCRSFENNEAETISPFARNTYMQSSAIRPTPTSKQQPRINPNEKSFSTKGNIEPCKCGGYSPRRQEFSESDILQGHTGKRVPCPYERGESDQELTKKKNNSGYRCRFKENENYSAGERENQTNCYHCIPKKYCVFYMTKSKSEEGNEVEVLVEELTERSKNNTKKDSKMTALKDKMKRIDECQLESMALRFQKGMNASAKTPENGRILYF